MKGNGGNRHSMPCSMMQAFGKAMVILNHGVKLDLCNTFPGSSYHERIKGGNEELPHLDLAQRQNPTTGDRGLLQEATSRRQHDPAKTKAGPVCWSSFLFLLTIPSFPEDPGGVCWGQALWHETAGIPPFPSPFPEKATGYYIAP